MTDCSAALFRPQKPLQYNTVAAICWLSYVVSRTQKTAERQTTVRPRDYDYPVQSGFHKFETKQSRDSLTDRQVA